MSDTLRTIFALPSLQEFIVICGMLLATYSTRLIGWLVLRRHPVSPRMQRILDAAPCCVMISIAAPAFMTTNIVTLVTLAATVVVALKTNLAITIVFAVAFNALLQTFFMRSSSRFFRGLKARAESYSSLRRSAGRAKACGLRV